MLVASDFGSKLKELREAAGFSQAALARVVGLSRQSISLFEKGESEPAWGTVKKIARALSISVAAFDDIATDTPDEPPPSPPAKKPAPKKPKG